MSSTRQPTVKTLQGCLIGIAVGDSMGLPGEGLSRKRIARWYPGPWKQRLLGSWGMCSDDTEHSFFVVQALAGSGGDVEAFRSLLAKKLRWWFLALPAGVGKATLKSCVKLCLGFSPKNSGVRSAGNGPAMRAPMLGAYFCNDREQRAAHVEASSAISHTDPLAQTGAQWVADLAADLANGTVVTKTWISQRIDQEPDQDCEWCATMKTVDEWLQSTDHLDSLASSMGLERGISGYTLHTVPMVIATVLRHLEEPTTGLEALFRCGGDTDTTCAIAGGLLGIHCGEDCWPKEWIEGIHNGPLSLPVMRQACHNLIDENPPVRWNWYWVPLRNLIFLLIILAHGFRRLLP